MKMRVYAAWLVTRADDSHPDTCSLYDYYASPEDAYEDIMKYLPFTFDKETMTSDDVGNEYMFLEKSITDLRGLV